MAAETTSHERHVVFQPTVVLIISLAAAALLSLYLLRYSILSASTFTFPPSFFYVVPIVVPFVGFLLDRAEHTRETTVVQVIIDVAIIGLAMARIFTSFPFISGHTLFLTYALGASRSRVVIATASLVMLQVIYLKYIVWHDAVTSTGGIIIGGIAAIVVRRLQQTRQKEFNNA